MDAIQAYLHIWSASLPSGSYTKDKKCRLACKVQTTSRIKPTGR